MINEYEIKKAPRPLVKGKTFIQGTSPVKDSITKLIKFEDLPPTTIVLNQPPVTHLKSHPINVAIKKFNKAVSLIWTSRPAENEKKLIKLAKKLGFNLSKLDITEKGVVESKDFRIQIKEKLLANLNAVFVQENGLNFLPMEQ